jgi:hypothetical protein
VRRRLAWLLGGVALARLFTGRRGRAPLPAAPAAPELEPDPRAAELRAKLAESKPLAAERDEAESGETPVDEADPDERRRLVHEAGRAAAEQMRGDPGA